MRPFIGVEIIFGIISIVFSCRSINKPFNCHLPESNLGGLDYPSISNIQDSSIFSYQLKDILPTADSLGHVYYASYFFKSFNEPNLSLKYQGKSTFRFIYSPWGSRGFVINMSCNEIIVKAGTKGYAEPFEDEMQLSPLERDHLNILRRYFPLSEQNFKPGFKEHYDSLIKLYPQLLTAEYYRSLTEKSIVRDSLPFEYSIRKVKLPPEKFEYFVNKINSSGFWQLPYEVDCLPAPSDGGGYIFEANTPNKYKIVISQGCPIDTMRLTKICQEIVNYAGLNKKIRLIP